MAGLYGGGALGGLAGLFADDPYTPAMMSQTGAGGMGYPGDFYGMGNAPGAGGGYPGLGMPSTSQPSGMDPSSLFALTQLLGGAAAAQGQTNAINREPGVFRNAAHQFTPYQINPMAGLFGLSRMAL